MDPHTSITPITDGEHWSDDTETSSEGTSPRHAGYAPLDQYQVLADEDEEEEEEKEEGEEGKEEPGGPAGGLAEAWREEAYDSRFAGNQARRQEGDAAALALRAMEADYRACVESERSLSNGPIDHAATSTSTERRPERPGEDADQESLNSAQEQAAGELGQGEGGGAAAAVFEVPRPISPLGQDRAGRVMRAMQGFALSAPTLPTPRFEVDWGSPDALSNLAATGETRREEEVAERHPVGSNEAQR